MNKQKNRSEIKKEDTWDLTYIFKTDEEFQKCLLEVEENIKDISSYEGKLLKDDKTLFSFLDLSDTLERKLYQLYYYAHLNLDVDTTNTKSQEMEGKVTNLLQKYSVLTSFVIPELLEGDYELVLEYIKNNSNLEKYRFNLESIYRYKNHSLSKEKEELLSHLSKRYISIS